MLPEIWDAKTDASGTNLKMKVPNGLKKEVSEWESAEEMSEFRPCLVREDDLRRLNLISISPLFRDSSTKSESQLCACAGRED